MHSINPTSHLNNECTTDIHSMARKYPLLTVRVSASGHKMVSTAESYQCNFKINDFIVKLTFVNMRENKCFVSALIANSLIVK